MVNATKQSRNFACSVSVQRKGGSLVFVGRTCEALVELLIDRGSTDDLTEAHQIVDQWPAQRPGIPALDLWWLKSSALLAKSEGDFGRLRRVGQ